jgi:hypothetical protein
MAFRILSLDGGGIKGTFSASVLAELERMTGKRMVDYFDLITGTSTGGIIALALGLGLSARDVLDFYEHKGTSIFPTTGVHRRLKYVYRFLGPQRNQRALREAVATVFGERSLGESSCRLLIPSYDGNSGRIHLFKTAHHPSYKQDYLKSAAEVALATSAAPTYFPAFTGTNGTAFLDGGIWANCPAMIGAIEAISVLKKDPTELEVLSVGTTGEPFHISARRRTGAFLFWNKGIVDLLLNAQADSIIGQVGILTGRSPLRVNAIVSPGRFGMDDATAIKDLVALGIREARVSEAEVSRRFLSVRAARFEPCPAECAKDSATQILPTID